MQTKKFVYLLVCEVLFKYDRLFYKIDDSLVCQKIRNFCIQIISNLYLKLNLHLKNLGLAYGFS